MLVIIILSLLLIIGIIFINISKKISKIKFKYLDNFDMIVANKIGFIGLIIIGISSICLFIFGTFIASVQIPKNKNYVEMVYKREVIELRLDNIEKDLVGNELIYHDIIEFNNKLHTIKKYSKSIWLNWFCNDLIATIDYIQIDEITYKEE